MKEYELTLNENRLEEEGVFAISLVDLPAIQKNWVMFSKQTKNENMKTQMFAKIKNEEKHIVTGPVMIPDFKILRFDEETNEEYYVYASKDTIEKLSFNFLRHYNQQNVTFNHSEYVTNVTMVESWLTGENDKSKDFGYDLPQGTWMTSFRVEDTNVWDKIKEGVVKGFSIEAFLNHNLVKQSLKPNEVILLKVKDLINKYQTEKK